MASANITSLVVYPSLGGLQEYYTTIQHRFLNSEILQESLTTYSRISTYAAAFILAACVYIVYITILRPNKPLQLPSSTLPNQVTSSTFTRPPAPPFPSTTLPPPIPYRPFRHGPKYYVTMGLRTLSWDSWLELDSSYLTYHALKKKRIEERGDKCVKCGVKAEAAAWECVREVAGYLRERYPGIFQPFIGKGRGEWVKNVLTGEVLMLDANGRSGNEAMRILARLLPDDIALMLPGDDGQYYLLAGAILLAGFWRLEDKFGMSLREIHTSGDVPQFKEKLETGMERFFKRLKPEVLMGRHNYFIQVDEGLDWSWSIGKEDDEKVGWDTAEKDRCVEEHWFRSERQSLRRLPKSGAIVFTIRTYFHPITEICKEPCVPGRLASAIRSWGDDVSRYKGRERYGDVLLEYLDKMHKEQVEAGLCVDAEEEEARGYPF